jgi:N6-adenosine-specific RNA methylase IME4
MLSPSARIAGTPFAGLRSGYYGAIMADVPARFETWAPTDPTMPGRRDTEQHYPTLSLAEIKQLPVAALAARDCWLFFWTSAPFLEQAFETIQAWGFTYSSIALTWVKLRRRFNAPVIMECDLHTSKGFTTRKGTEICLLARKGTPHRHAKDVHEVILCPVREHSRKPDEAYARVQRHCAGPYLDLYGRETRDAGIHGATSAPSLIGGVRRAR